jgi:hypothetical protein
MPVEDANSMPYNKPLPALPLRSHRAIGLAGLGSFGLSIAEKLNETYGWVSQLTPMHWWAWLLVAVVALAWYAFSPTKEEREAVGVLSNANAGEHSQSSSVIGDHNVTNQTVTINYYQEQSATVVSAASTPTAGLGPKIRHLNSHITFDTANRTISTTVDVRVESGDVAVRSSFIAHVRTPVIDSQEQLRRTRILRGEAEALAAIDAVSPVEYPLSGGASYRIPAGPSQKIERHQFADWFAGRAEYVWGILMIAKNEHGIKTFWFCGINMGPHTSSSPCPIIPGDNNE